MFGMGPDEVPILMKGHVDGSFRCGEEGLGCVVFGIVLVSILVDGIACC